MQAKAGSNTRSKRKHSAIQAEALRPEYSQGALPTYILNILLLLLAGVGGYLAVLGRTAPVPTGTTLVGVAGKCLDNQFNRKSNYNKIQLYACDQTDAQRWTINTNGTITNNNGYCLDVYHADTKSGAPVDLYQCNGTVAQQWVINTATKAITNPHSGLCLDDRYASGSNGNPIWIHTCNNTRAQQWTITALPMAAPGISSPGSSGAPGSNGSAADTGGRSSNTSSTGGGATSGGGGSSSGGGSTSAAVTPDGVPGTWKLSFDDEFTKDNSLNQSLWTQTSAAEGECGQGNHGNDQAEWNQAYTNDTVDAANGLVITDKRQTVKACGDTFTWTGGLISSKQSFSAGDVIEEKFQIPSTVPGGGWDSFWTWCADGSNGCEVDVYELYPPNSYGNGTGPSTDHVGGGTTGSVMNYISLGVWHTMDAVINSHSVTWYLDGKNVGSANNSTSEGAFNLILDNDVCNNNGCPGPDSGTTVITENVAYVRVWSP